MRSIKKNLEEKKYHRITTDFRYVFYLNLEDIAYFEVRTMKDNHYLPIRSTKRKIIKNLVVIRVSFNDIDSEVEFKKTGKTKTRIRIKLLEVKKYEKRIRITLKKIEREIASSLLDWDYVSFENIPFGHYSISLNDNNIKFGEYFFEIKETCHEKK